MAVTDMPSTARPLDAGPIRTIQSSDLNSALREGYSDFLDKRGDLIFAGLLYPLIGLVAATVTLGGSLIPLFMPIVAGIGLLGPLAAIGFYELARRREAGLESDWSHFLDFRKRPNFGQIIVLASLLVAIFAAWLVAAAVLYTLFLGEPPASVGSFVTQLFTTAEGWGLILVGNLVGLAFAVLAMTVSVVSLPMLVDRDVDAATAIRLSVMAVAQNKAMMARWGATVIGLLILGSIPLFIGLAFVLPWLGYATWHLYTRVVERS